MVITVLCSVVLTTTYAQPPKENIITQAVRTGNASLIAKYFENVVDFTFANGQSAFSHSQAEMVLKNFFRKNIPIGFDITDTGHTDNNRSFYQTGTMTTNNGVFRVYISLKQKGNSYTVQEMRFE